jgi:hypothetical protein
MMTFSYFRMPVNGRDRVLDTLNYEHGKPGLRDARSTAALSHGLDRIKPTIGIGFKPEE